MFLTNSRPIHPSVKTIVEQFQSGGQKLRDPQRTSSQGRSGFESHSANRTKMISESFTLESSTKNLLVEASYDGLLPVIVEFGPGRCWVLSEDESSYWLFEEDGQQQQQPSYSQGLPSGGTGGEGGYAQQRKSSGNWWSGVSSFLKGAWDWLMRKLGIRKDELQNLSRSYQNDPKGTIDNLTQYFRDQGMSEEEVRKNVRDVQKQMSSINAARSSASSILRKQREGEPLNDYEKHMLNQFMMSDLYNREQNQRKTQGQGTTQRQGQVVSGAGVVSPNTQPAPSPAPDPDSRATGQGTTGQGTTGQGTTGQGTTGQGTTGQGTTGQGTTGQGTTGQGTPPSFSDAAAGGATAGGAADAGAADAGAADPAAGATAAGATAAGATAAGATAAGADAADAAGGAGGAGGAADAAGGGAADAAGGGADLAAIAADPAAGGGADPAATAGGDSELPTSGKARPLVPATSPVSVKLIPMDERPRPLPPSRQLSPPPPELTGPTEPQGSPEGSNKLALTGPPTMSQKIPEETLDRILAPYRDRFTDFRMRNLRRHVNNLGRNKSRPLNHKTVVKLVKSYGLGDEEANDLARQLIAARNVQPFQAQECRIFIGDTIIEQGLHAHQLMMIIEGVNQGKINGVEFVVGNKRMRMMAG